MAKSFSESRAVSMIMGTVLIFRSSVQIVKPSEPGIITSRMASSQGSCEKRSSSRSPVGKSSTA